jgi:sec-independent protein translocase protein TatA
MPGYGLIQPWHLLLILLIVLVVFGAGKLSQVGGALGQSVKDFKESLHEGDDEEVAGAEPAATQTRSATAARSAEHSVERVRREEI